MRAAAERARGEIAVDGVPRTELRACSAEDDDGTRLARCLKVYVPLGDRPASERPYAMVLESGRGARRGDDVALHRLRGAPPAGRYAQRYAVCRDFATCCVYERAHKRLHGRYPDQ